MYDYLIEGGSIVDGLNTEPYTGDVAIKDGRFVEVGGRISASAKETIDAAGCIVTPGWVDIHTHYDGQVTWDSEINPSASHGVSTVVMGNCGVGFAPVHKGQEKKLIELMEGVEDIPGTALYEGMPWGAWESYPEYLDYLAGREYSLDVGSMIAHGALRSYVMGDRSYTHAPANSEDLNKMGALVQEALTAGALGFSTSRILGHMSVNGEQVPGTFAADEEMMAIASAVGSVGHGLMQMIPASTIGSAALLGGEQHDLMSEVDLMARLSKQAGRPLTFTLFQISEWPHLWREVLAETAKANAQGAQLFPQVGSRPTGIVMSLLTYHPFMRKPSFMKLRSLPAAERLLALKKPEVKAAILAEAIVPHELPGTMENVVSLMPVDFERTFAMGDDFNHEPTYQDSFAVHSAQASQPAPAFLYDFLVAGEGQNRAIMYFTNYHDYNLDAVHEMQSNELTVTGLSDAGAHVSVIFDAVAPTYQLTYWARDREKPLALPYMVHRQSYKNAQLFGLEDRGAIQPGLRADLNVIDFDGLALGPVELHHDLPAQGGRLLQSATGYVATLVKGVRTRDQDQDTGMRPGRLVRGGAC